MAGDFLLTRIRNRTERLRQRGWRSAAYTSTARPLVMGGAPRSGTTLLRRIFDRHPAITAGPESKLFVPAAFNLEWLSRAYEIPLADLRQKRDRDRSSLDGLTVSVDDDRGDQEFLQDLADRNDFFVLAITYASGEVYQGSAQIVGEFTSSSQNATAAISLMGPGILTKQ